MGKLKQSFVLEMFRKDDTDLEELLKQAAGIGYKAVEIWGRDGVPFEELLDLTAKHGLVIASMMGHQSLTDGLNNPDNHDRIEDELKESIELAAKRGIPGLICFSGNREGRDDERSIGICAEGLKRSAGFAEEKSINLNLELLNSRHSHPDYQCDHTEWGVQVVKAVGSSRVKLLYDIFHMQIMEGDLIHRIREFIEHIGHFHTAGVPGRGPVWDQDQEINYPAVCRAIAVTGYDLYVGHEFTFDCDPAEALQKAFDTCNI